jgi:hypothetical protein
MRHFCLLLLWLNAPAFADTVNCRDWFAAQQTALDRRDIHDAGSTRVDGHPHLRVNRWLAFLYGEANSDARRELWLQLAADEARRGWQAELTRLHGDRHWAAELDHCLNELTRFSAFYGVPLPQVEDGYANWQRVLGIYPLSRRMATPSMRRYQRDMQARLRRPARPALRHYLPEAFQGNQPVPNALAPNAFDLPLPRGGSRDALLAHYAPVLSIADLGDDNLPGRVRLNAGKAEIDSHEPVVYQWLSWTRYRGHNLLQLNYQFWFTRRPKKGLFDIYAGELDSLIWRVTLKPDGNVLYYDSIHACGCYHKVFTVARGLYPAKSDGDRPIYAAQPAANAASRRISLLIEPDTHYLVRVAAFSADAEQYRYQRLDADELRQLPDQRGGFDSLFNARGLIPESRRSERFLLWPLGVPSAGAMRQPGRHAIAFIGRRHFDEPTITEMIFAP